MSLPQIVLLSGFLGSGKTTLMTALAKKAEAQGQRASVITNDQSDNLVDTQFTALSGLDSHEISGGCFCCRFPDLIETIKTVCRNRRPHLIFAEAVGSCTDIVATVVRPLHRFHKDLVTIRAFWVVADGLRLVDEYRQHNLTHPGLPLESLISHQIREGAILVQSKCDLLSPEQQEKGSEYLREINPLARIVPCSAITGEGLDTLMQASMDVEALSRQVVFIDYDIYAEAERQMGWYNGSWTVKHAQAVDPEQLSFDWINHLKTRLRGNAHSKLQIVSPHGSIKISLAGRQIRADEIQPLKPTTELQLILNIRAGMDPQEVKALVAGFRDRSPHSQISQLSETALQPARPEPTYPPGR